MNQEILLTQSWTSPGKNGFEVSKKLLKIYWNNEIINIFN